MRTWDDGYWSQIEANGRRTLNSRSFQQAHALVISQLLATENFPLDAPKQWPVDGSRSDKEAYLELLDDMDVYEIGNAIRDRSILEEEAKNS
jgi:hypothetical protein